MDDLVAFLNARLDEREALALAAKENERRWRYSEGGGAVMLVDGGYVAVGPYGCDIDEDYGRHIAVNDPAYVLDDVEAKRQIIALSIAATRQFQAKDSAFAQGASFALYRTVKILALPYADHPDYQGSWRP
ncbi:MAG: hypothetical protein JWQ81_8498 [Amycolatopsis sp.]|uniref:DUF6221 family protein n=1 Tax=Amycolatopsis sp. TaxID=37632 RepID=UPI00261DE948|nr:DUF6221 family protein [Amycolatopsis sp.]MCU1687759.1 hypothetical protein [Amycolatopsis sp.]